MCNSPIPEQINPWLAIGFAIECIDDHHDRLEFLKSCRENDMETIGENTSASVLDGWPEFVAWVRSREGAAS